jgi:hypothetical protein
MKNILKIIDRGRVWNLANSYIYKIFEENFDHSTDEKILAKTWILGKTYSVALERSRTKKTEKEREKFYETKVVELFKESNLDDELNELKIFKELDLSILPKLLMIHKRLCDKIITISSQNRSFSSKYLHFHLPNLFFIYDSIATTKINALLKLFPELKEKIKLEKIKFQSDINEFDVEYFNFCLKCFFILKLLEEKFEIKLSIRKFDDLLLYITKDEIKELSFYKK